MLRTRGGVAGGGRRPGGRTTIAGGRLVHPDGHALAPDWARRRSSWSSRAASASKGDVARRGRHRRPRAGQRPGGPSLPADTGSRSAPAIGPFPSRPRPWWSPLGGKMFSTLWRPVSPPHHRRAHTERAKSTVGATPSSGGTARAPREGTTVTYVITQACVDVLDKACIDECPVDCIYEATGCSTSTPTSAWTAVRASRSARWGPIYYEDDVPDKWKDFYDANMEFFSDLGSPGGAAKTGKIGKDHPLVAALPPRGGRPLTTTTPGGSALRTFPGTPLAGAAPGRSTPAGWSTYRSARRSTTPPSVLGRALAAGRTPQATPTALGTAERPDGGGRWLRHRLGVPVADPLGAGPRLVPTVGSKGSSRCSTLLGLRGAGTVLIPEVAYPTYEVGGPGGACRPPHRRAPGRRRRCRARLAELAGESARPGVHRGPVAGVGRLGPGVRRPRGRRRCYVTLGWDVEPRSLLHSVHRRGGPRGPARGAFAVEAIPAAGYRAGLLSGDRRS